MSAVRRSRRIDVARVEPGDVLLRAVGPSRPHAVRRHRVEHVERLRAGRVRLTLAGQRRRVSFDAWQTVVVERAAS